MKISGIYKIESKLKPQRIYIGSAVNISDRWYVHLSDLKHNKHSSIKLQRHYNKYGESDLRFSILLGCEKDDLIKTEQYFLDSYNPYFNISKIAGSSRGYKHSEEAKIKISESQKGNKKWLGKKHTEETKRKISIAKKGGDNHRRGIRHSEETRRKMSETKMRNHENNKN